VVYLLSLLSPPFFSQFTPSHTACVLGFNLHAFISFVFATTLVEVVWFFLSAAFCWRLFINAAPIFRSKSARAPKWRERSAAGSN